MSQRTIFCGFADVFLHDVARNANDVKLYNEEMGKLYPRMKADVISWVENKSIYREYLNDKINFGNKIENQTKYTKHFSMERWRELPRRERQQHSAYNCLRCISYPPFKLKRVNLSASSPQEKSTKDEETQTLLSDFLNLLSSRMTSKSYKIMLSSGRSKRCIKPDVRITVDNVPAKVKREIIQEAQNRQRKESRSRELSSLMTNGVSFSKWDKTRATKYGFYKKIVKVKNHIGPLASYVFCRTQAAAYLRDIARGTLELENKMTGKWSKFAEKLNVRTITGRRALKLNGSQVMQSYALSLGYTFKTRRVQRVTWYKHEGQLAGYRSSHSYVLTSVRDKFIANGTIDIGTAIAPITTSIQRYDTNQKKVIHKEQTIYGRRISLQKIREHHLKLMNDKGLLRNTDISLMERDELISTLETHGANFNEEAPLEDLIRNVEDLETTRHMVLWQDHSDIAGHSHYVLTVWFIYDDAVFKSKDEVGFDVQSIVEQPFLYMIGRSKSSVSDQLLYIPERAADLEHSRVPILFNGRYYYDKIRFNSGDLPARQFESGQAIGGDYPCHCGVEGKAFKNLDQMLQVAPFYRLSERIGVIRQLSNPQHGLVINKMKREELENELKNMKAPLTGNHKLDELRNLLKAKLKGIRRLPAICHTGLSLKDMNCENYEVSWCDPLHDLNNLIQQILRELPGCVESSELQMKVSDFCDNAIGERRLMRGCNARLHLINLTLLVEENKFHVDSQCRDIYQMLSALCEIQRLAYQLASERSSKNVLRFHLQSLIFAVKFSEVFNKLIKEGKRGIFSTPFHSVITHMAEMYRLVSLRSIVTETSERIFHTLKQMTTATNKQPQNVLKNIILRMHFCKEEEVSSASSAFLQQQARVKKNEIATTAKSISRSGGTRLSNSFINKNKTVVLWTFRRIADFLLFGPGVWYNVDEDGITFADGEQDPSLVDSPALSHFRSSTLQDVQSRLAEYWEICKINANDLKLDVITSLSANKPETSTKKVLFDKDKASSYIKTETFGQYKNMEWDEDEVFPHRRPTPNKRTYGSPSVPPNLQSMPNNSGKGEAQDNSLVAPPTPRRLFTNNNKRKAADMDSYEKETRLVKLWKGNGFKGSILMDYLSLRDKAEGQGKHTPTYTSYMEAFKKVFPYLQNIERNYQLAVEMRERQYYKKHRKLSTECVDKDTIENMRVCRHYQVKVRHSD